MKTFTFIIALVVALSLIGVQSGVAGNKFVGAKTCSMCHKANKVAETWAGSKHAQAFKNLGTEAADKIAKEKGFKTKAAETPECLACHTIAAKADECEKSFDAKDGVQCEACHGAGSAFKSPATMKDHAKAIAAGLTDFKAKDAIEAKCKTCHNDKSPTFKGFKFEEMYAKIKHAKKS